MPTLKGGASVRPVPTLILVPFLKKVEASVMRVYDDKRPKYILKAGDAVKGTLTGGVGHTGPDLRIGMAVTQAMVDRWLDADILNKAAVPLAQKIGAAVDGLTAHQYAALLSFVFNLGTGDPKKPEWTIWKRLRAGQLDQVPGEMLKFINWDGQKSQALVNRRTAEIQLWHMADPQVANSAPPSSVTRSEPTPPTPASPRSFSAPVITTAATAITTGTVAVTQVTDVLQPFSGRNGHIDNLLSILVMIAAGLAVAGLVVAWLKHRADRN